MPELSVALEPVNGPVEFITALDQALLQRDPETYRVSRLTGRWAWRLARVLELDAYQTDVAYTAARAFMMGVVPGAVQLEDDGRTMTLFGIREDSDMMLYDTIQVLSTCGDGLRRAKRVNAKFGSIDFLSAVVMFAHVYVDRTNGDREHEGIAQLFEWLLRTSGVEHHPLVIGGFQTILAQRLRETSPRKLRAVV